MSTFEEIAATADFGRPSARKTGRNPAWPYVPILIVDGPRPIQKQILGRAYATRAEAIEDAERHVATLRRNLARDLASPRMRALREQHGLPRELAE